MIRINNNQYLIEYQKLLLYLCHLYYILYLCQYLFIFCLYAATKILSFWTLLKDKTLQGKLNELVSFSLTLCSLNLYCLTFNECCNFNTDTLFIVHDFFDLRLCFCYSLLQLRPNSFTDRPQTHQLKII